MGIIPARAGFTDSDAFVVRLFEDHPRSRGVYEATGAPTRLFRFEGVGGVVGARG